MRAWSAMNGHWPPRSVGSPNVSKTRAGSRCSSGAYSKYRDRVRGTNVTLTSPSSAICAIGVGSSSTSKKRRRYWAASHSKFHLPTAPTISSPEDSSIGKATYSGAVGSRGRMTPPKRKPADMLFSRGNSSAVLLPAGRSTLSRRHVWISAAVGSRSSLTMTSSVLGLVWGLHCCCFICVIPTSRQLGPNPFRCPRATASGVAPPHAQRLLVPRSAFRSSTHLAPAQRPLTARDGRVSLFGEGSASGRRRHRPAGRPALAWILPSIADAQLSEHEQVAQIARQR